MSRFIQSLESRTLFTASATEAVLLADVKAVLAAAITAKADLKSGASTVGADTKVVATDLKASTTKANRAANATLLRILKADEQKTLATLRAHGTSLLAVGTSLSKRAAADGKALLLHPADSKLQAKVAADISTLQTVPAGLLATLQADSLSTLISTDLTALVNANVTNSQLAAQAQATASAESTAVANVITAAGSFDTATGALDAAVSSTPSGSTIPSLIGHYTGTATRTTGNNIGSVDMLSFNITGEDASGALTGSATYTKPGKTPINLTLTGSVTASGAFAGALTDPTGQNNGASLTGTVAGKTISGTYTSAGDGGTFTVTKP